MCMPYTRIVHEEEILVDCPYCGEDVIRFVVGKNEDADKYIFMCHCRSCDTVCSAAEFSSLLSYLRVCN